MSAEPALRFSTGSSPGTRAGHSFCESKTRTSARNSEEAVKVIYEGLRWLGLDWDEGPLVGGAHGPYFQSERASIYLRYFERLQEAGHIYEDHGAWRFRFRARIGRGR